MIHRTRTAAGALIIAVLLIMLAGCGRRETVTATMWTDRTSVAAYVEMYNAAQERYKIEVEFTPAPADALLERQRHPDIVLGDYLANESTFDHFTPLDNLLADDAPAEGDFYPGLLSLGRRGGETYLLPVAFDLPALMFKRSELNEGLDQFRLPVERLREEGAEFNESTDEGYVRVGFSPRWSGEFLYVLAMSHGANFREQGRRNTAWNHGALEESAAYVRDWVEEVNGGFNAERDFEERYLYDPPYQLLLRDRIRFSYTTAGRFYSIAESSRRNVDLRWLSREGSIPVLENIFYVGIPAEARHAAVGRDFIRWLFDEETQAALVDAVSRKRLEAFGIAGGFSALVATNEEALPRAFPGVLGRVPPASLLDFPLQVPKNWDEIKEDVVHPWLRRELTDDASPEELREAIQAWTLQKGD
ncbi:MAG: extracellular solute-binding protein [Spirochaetaceae bacterium]